jgi:hypothetical protein
MSACVFSAAVPGLTCPIKQLSYLLQLAERLPVNYSEMLTGSRFTTRGFPVDDIFLHNLALQEGIVFDFGDRGEIFIFIFLLVSLYVYFMNFTIKEHAYLGNMTLKKMVP